MKSLERTLYQYLGFVNSPDLWKNSPKEYPPLFKLINTGEPIGLSDFEIPENLILGKRIEYFFRLYLNAFSDEEILTAGTQIRQGKITIGEIDFLLRNKILEELTHLELVFKYYLYDPSITKKEERWIGPNRSDSLARKLNRLRTHQFPLLFHGHTMPLLRQLGIAREKIIQKLCFKATLFLPYKSSVPDLGDLNPECIVGYWLRSSEFTASEFGASQFYSPQKRDWPMDPENSDVWISYEEIVPVITELLQKKRSPLIWMKSDSKQFSRFFVVWW